MRMFGERFCNQRDLHINSNSTINQELNMFFKRLSSSVMGVIDVVDNHKKMIQSLNGGKMIIEEQVKPYDWKENKNCVYFVRRARRYTTSRFIICYKNYFL